MTELKEIELLLLNTIIEANADKFGFLKAHLSLVGIESRETTGIGLYVRFIYRQELEEEEFVNGLISAEQKLMSPNLKNELTYCLDITNGKLDFLEIATNGNEIWDGNLDNCTLIES